MVYDGESEVQCLRCGYGKGGFDHLHMITDWLAVGAEASATDETVLALMGINAVLTVANDFPIDANIPRPSFRVDLKDSEHNNVEDFLEAVDLLNWLRGENGRVLVHCMGGARRSVAVACFLLSEGDRERYWELVQKFKETRSVVNPEGGIHDFVERKVWNRR